MSEQRATWVPVSRSLVEDAQAFTDALRLVQARMARGISDTFFRLEVGRDRLTVIGDLWAPWRWTRAARR